MADPTPNMVPITVEKAITLAQRGQYWPTLPKQYGVPGVVSIVRYYSCGVAPADADNVLNAAIPRIVHFNLPCVACHVTGTCITSDGSGLPVGWNPNDCYEVLLEAGSGAEKITISSRLASTVVGTAERPGFLGGGGWIFPAGSDLNVTITPRLPGLPAGVNTRIDIVFGCLEFRYGSSYILPGGTVAGG